MWYVYILLCSNKSLYAGISNDPQKRFQDHKKGNGGKYTRGFKPIKMVYLEKVPTRSDALKKEALIKGWSRKDKIAILKLKF